MGGRKPDSHYDAIIKAIKELDARLEGNKIWFSSRIEFKKKKNRRKMKKNENRI